MNNGFAEKNCFITENKAGLAGLGQYDMARNEVAITVSVTGIVRVYAARVSRNLCYVPLNAGWHIGVVVSSLDCSRDGHADSSIHCSHVVDAVGPYVLWVCVRDHHEEFRAEDDPSSLRLSSVWCAVRHAEKVVRWELLQCPVVTYDHCLAVVPVHPSPCTLIVPVRVRESSVYGVRLSSSRVAVEPDAVCDPSAALLVRVPCCELLHPRVVAHE